ncbi:coiled-coil domain-containing protein 40 [Caerostris extrusa]|uniref:Coiled-coil domain-containing protein 40 n=1 Tax=Caerostris extrusa TaxID=172846 RepID=A0AAV4NFJ4_CAEEX|nr:coiled-coil domain-containing protein 40 [Caerostris extrusa]
MFRLFHQLKKKSLIEKYQFLNLELQTKLEDASFEVVQLTSLQMETYTDAKSLKRAVEKTVRERENLEVEKLRQDLLISRFENDKFNLEDKINRHKTQWSIKKKKPQI